MLLHIQNFIILKRHNMIHNTAKRFLHGIRNNNLIQGIISVSFFSLCLTANVFGMQLGLPDELEILFDDMSNVSVSDFSINLASFGLNSDDISAASWSTNSDDLGNVYFAAVHTHNVLRNASSDPLNGNGNTELSSIFENNSVVYNPANQGAIGSISFSLAARLPVGAPLGGIDSVGFTILQGNTSVSFFTPYLDQSDEWQTYSIDGLTQEAFGEFIDLSGSTDLRFGFGFLSRFDATLGDQTFAIDADNFRVSITAVPEPSSFLLLIPVAIAAAARLRTRKALTAA